MDRKRNSQNTWVVTPPTDVKDSRGFDKLRDKPLDWNGKRQWLPHSNNVRQDAWHKNTSTK